MLHSLSPQHWGHSQVGPGISHNYLHHFFVVLTFVLFIFFFVFLARREEYVEIKEKDKEEVGCGDNLCSFYLFLCLFGKKGGVC